MRDQLRDEAKILIIDDEPVAAGLLGEILESQGYRQIEKLTDPREAAARFAEWEPDLVVLDWMMPALSGSAVLQQLRRAVSAETYLPILVVTALPQLKTKHEALANGATDFLTKPYDTPEIVWRVTHLLETRFLHRRMEEQNRRIAAEQARLTALFDNVLDAIVIADDEGHYVDANPAASALLGYTKTELLSMGAGDLLPQVDHESKRERWDAFVKEGTESGQLSLLRKDGSKVAAEYRSVANFLPGLHLSVLRDVTARQRAEAALHATDARLRTIVETTPALVFIKDLESRFVMMNKRFEAFFGIPPEEIIGRTNYHFLPPERAAQVQENDRRVFADREPLEFEDTVEVRGEPRTFLSVKAPLYDAAGEVCGLCGIATDITERKRTEEVARLAKEEAERANAAKSEFLSRMSHELRTPLNSILGFAQLFELEAQTPEARENVEQILKGGHQLLRLIDEVLDISRIEAGRMALTIEPLPVELIFNATLTLMRPMAAARKVQLGSLECDREVLADEQRLQQVLLNLISNAIKYNREGGRVSFGCSETATNTLRLTLRDTGMGISPADQEKLFVPFERVGEMQKKVEGIGLGLAISKRLIELMGGAIGVESELGTGTTFWIELPLRRPLPEGPDAEPSGEIESQGSKSKIGKTLLYIEDNPSNLALIEQIMAFRPHVKMHAAQHPVLGLEMAREHLPDLILLDLHLPDMNGDVVLARLRADPATAHIPVVMISAVAMGAEIERLKKLGASAYLTKPFDVSEFLSVLDDALQAG